MEWREIPGYSGRYHVSSEGEVYSTGGVFATPGRWGTMRRKVQSRLLKPALASNGYLFVSLRRRDDGKRCVNAYIHRLVAEAFVPNPLGLKCVNHLDGNKHNNQASNLEWVTHQQNHLHRTRVLGRGPIGETHHKAKLTTDDVKEIRQSKALGKELAQRYGVSQTVISNIRLGKSWIHCL